MVWPSGKKQDQALLENREDLAQAQAEEEDAPNLTLDEVNQALGLL
ncbi:hypothetical protein VB712_10810 [Spirulina sp. CCNP1310]|nr:hypothetical protein [Spirulina sp. CCNP1310]MEA5419713.1 hypothetical protein [Spirulina sp. CCNP1310]